MKSLELNSLEKTKKLAVLMHGVGSDGYDLINIAPYFQAAMPDTYFYSPNGVEKYDEAEFGYQWFSFKIHEEEHIRRGMQSNMPKIEKLIYNKLVELKIEENNLILIGFSQGAMVSIELTLASILKPIATIAFSGMIIPPVKITNNKTPICLIHGKEDQIILVDNVYSASNYLNHRGITNETHVIDDLAHTIDSRGIDYAINFLSNIR